jgi:hypothetical protein
LRESEEIAMIRACRVPDLGHPAGPSIACDLIALTDLPRIGPASILTTAGLRAGPVLSGTRE